MMSLTLYVISLASLIGLARVAVVVRRSDDRFVGWLVFLVLLTSLTGTTVGLSSQDTAAVVFVLLGFLIFGAFSRPSDRSTGQPLATIGAVVVLFAMPAFLAASNLALIPEIDIRAVARFVPVLTWPVVAIYILRARLTLREVSLAVISAFLIIAAAIPFYAETWHECSVFKCGPFGVLLAGPFNSENLLARFAGIVVLCGLVVADRYLASATIVVGALVMYATSSRTSLLALVLALAVWGAVRIAPRLARVSTPAIVVAGAASLILYIGWSQVLGASKDDYSDRGLIWTLGREALEGHFWSGKGVDTWSTEVLARNYMHSEALFLTYSAGLLAMGFYVITIAVCFGAARRHNTGLRLAYMTYLLIIGVTEIAWNPIAFDITSVFGIMVVALACAHVPADSAPKVEPDTSERKTDVRVTRALARTGRL